MRKSPAAGSPVGDAKEATMAALHALLLAAVAVAAEPDPAATLSRFPAGAVPPSETVLDAISALGRAGGPGDVPLLEAIAEDESGLVALAALAATDAIQERGVAAQRAAFSANLPSPAEVMRAAADLGGPHGPAESEAVAYARAVLGSTDAPATLDTVSPERARALVADGDRAERAARPRDALTLYAQAAASGDDSAPARIAAFGVDQELLLLGMTASGGPAPAAVLEPLAVESLASAGADRTVRVLVERARDPRPLVRIVALDALADMVRRRRVPSDLRGTARDTLEAARRDPRPDVAEAAQALLPPRTHP